jgi:hypothetical protein
VNGKSFLSHARFVQNIILLLQLIMYLRNNSVCKGISSLDRLEYLPCACVKSQGKFAPNQIRHFVIFCRLIQFIKTFPFWATQCVCACVWLRALKLVCWEIYSINHGYGKFNVLPHTKVDPNSILIFLAKLKREKIERRKKSRKRIYYVLVQLSINKSKSFNLNF